MYKILLNKKNRSRAEWQAIYKFRLMYIYKNIYIYIYIWCVCVCMRVYTNIITDFCSPLICNFFLSGNGCTTINFITFQLQYKLNQQCVSVCEWCVFINNILIKINKFPISAKAGLNMINIIIIMMGLKEKWHYAHFINSWAHCSIISLFLIH